MQGYKTGENCGYLGLEPHFLIFDEYIAFMEMPSARERDDVLGKPKQMEIIEAIPAAAYTRQGSLCISVHQGNG